jgi:hypothetical protein
MSAPLPLRFYNPVKGLCKKANLDYDTVIASTLTNKTIVEAFINSELKKPLEEQRFEDRQNLKKQKELFAKKYGDRISTDGASSGDAEDKGRTRYDLGISVEHILPDPSKVDESAAAQNSSEVVADSKYGKESIKYLPPKQKWVPGLGRSNAITPE